MANLSLLDATGASVTYNGITSIVVPTTGGGTVTFTEGGGGGGYTINVTAPTGSTVTATKDGETYTGTEDSGVFAISVPETGTYTITATLGGNTDSDTITVKGDLATLYPSNVGTLEATSWADISAISQAGYADRCWDIGDTKSVVLNGTMGDSTNGQTFSNTTLYVFIIGFDHNADVEGKGITFQGFKTAATNGVDVCLIAKVYQSTKTDGSKCFNMNHWGNYNYGGWAACDMRYDILGSTNVAPKGYGSARSSTNNIGYDATSTCATSPVSNTLMSCLPSTLRAVMKPITKWTDNYGDANKHTESRVTTSIDYLPLLSAGEVFGGAGGNYANRYEAKHQKRYEYYALGNNTVKYRHSSTGSTANWWCRSANYNNTNNFCNVNTNGNVNNNNANNSYGVAPDFNPWVTDSSRKMN